MSERSPKVIRLRMTQVAMYLKQVPLLRGAGNLVIFIHTASFHFVVQGLPNCVGQFTWANDSFVIFSVDLSTRTPNARAKTSRKAFAGGAVLTTGRF